MQSFEDWCAACTVPAARTYADTLLSLGISHHTFRRPPEDVIQDLLTAGLPRLAASDIVHAAKAFFDAQKERASLPLAVFWDVENVRIPSELSGERVARSIKQKMKPFGRLDVFNAYFEVSSTHMPAEKRSGLQLSGCHIIDTPHINRKEVADKMIIVDALLFAMRQKEHGGTLCFITGDTDYAYMLSRLSEFKQFRTVLVTGSTTRDVLHMSAHAVFSWSLDILGGGEGGFIPGSPVGFVSREYTRGGESGSEREDESEMSGRSPGLKHNQSRGGGRKSPQHGPLHTDRMPSGFPVDQLPQAVTGSSPPPEHTSTSPAANDKNDKNKPSPVSTTIAGTPSSKPKGKDSPGSTTSTQVGASESKSPQGKFPRIESLADMLPTAQDEEADAMILVRQVMYELQTGMNYRPLKSLVGIKLKEKNPIRFGDKGARTKALEKAAHPMAGFLRQEGEGGNVTLSFRTDAFRPPHD